MRKPLATDEQLEARLRDVVLPPGFLPRLLGTVETLSEPATTPVEAPPAASGGEDAADAELAAMLNQVPLPPGLVERVARSALQRPSPDECDRLLCAVRVPEGLHERLLHVVEERSIPRWPRWAVAAGLLLAVAAAAVAGLSRHVGPRGPLGLAQQTPSLEVQFSEVDTEALPDAAAWIALEPAVEGLQLETPLLHQPAVTPAQRAARALAGDTFWQDLLAAGGESSPIGEEINRHAWEYGFPVLPDRRSPGLLRAADWQPRGIAPPESGPFDWNYFLEHGVHPFVLTEHYPQSVVPLGATTTGYELARQLAAEGRLPPRHAVRTEEFLAAADSLWAPGGEEPVSLRTAAGPSPFRPELHLLQLGVAAGAGPRDSWEPTHLTVAVDISAPMAGHRAAVAEGLRRLIGTLGPDDRLSLVVFHQSAAIWGEQMTAGEAEALLSRLTTATAGDEADYGAGLQRAFSVAGEGVARSRRSRVALVAQGLGTLDALRAARLAASVAAAARDGIGLDVLACGPRNPGGAWLAALADAGQGRLHWISRAEEVGWACEESLAGRPRLAACDAELTVRFDPKAVRAYRLLGYEQSLGHPAGEVRIDLRAGQATSAVFELQLTADTGHEVAVAQLTWVDPADGQRHTREQRISRVQFAPTFRQSPLPLQMAALLAQTAEVLRGSPPARGGNLADVMQLLPQVSPALSGREEFMRFTDLLRSAAAARP